MGKSSRGGLPRAWFILPALLLLAALVLAGFGVSSFVSLVRSDFRSYQQDSTISVTADGLTLYVESGTPELNDLRCTATGSDATTPLPPFAGRHTLTNGRGSFVSIASTPADLRAGRYVLSCVSPSGDADVPLYLGARADLAAVGRLVIVGIVAPLFLGLCSVALFAILALLRYRSRRVTRQAASSAVFGG